VVLRLKIGLFGDVPQANRLVWYGKTKPNTTKARIHQSKETYNTKNIKKLKPGLVACCDIRPGNTGPILVVVLHKFVPHLLT